jgi:hypothetical protein
MFFYSKNIFLKQDYHYFFEKTLRRMHNIDFDGFKHQSSTLYQKIQKSNMCV